MYQNIDISKNWKITHYDLDEGLLISRGKRAYEEDYVPSDYVEADMPITAQAAYIAEGKIKDPYVGMNNYDAIWMEQKDWWYYQNFDADKTNGQYRLTFEGVNYRADAWLNGVQLATWEGTFLTKYIDILQDMLKEKGNSLVVRIRAQERAWEDGTAPYHRGHQNSNAVMRTQRPTPQFAYGWNWSPHLIAVGMWKPVKLEWMETARLTEDKRIHASLTNNDFTAGNVNFKGYVEGLCEEARDVTVEMTVKGPNGFEQTASAEVKGVKKGSTQEVSVDLAIDKPELWWPVGYGEQALYDIEVKVLCKGELCDSHARKQGFRDITFIPNTDDIANQALSGQTNRMWSVVGTPYPWTMVVNGKTVFLKGTNWCPVDNLYRDRDDHIRRTLEFAAESNYTMVRVWGGGLTESDFFYDTCDELGLICFQEFWFACGSAPAMDYEVFVKNVRSELYRLRERSSIAFWGGGNEFNPDNKENKPLINLIDQLCEEIDGTRELRRGSPYRGDRHGGLVTIPTRITNKYSDLLPGKTRIVLMRSEMAVGRSPMRPSNIKKFIPEDSLWPIDWTMYQNHHAQRPEWEQVTKPFGVATEWEDELIRSSVLHCIDSRMNLEYARQLKYECSGCLTWQINSSWPTFHREHIDWYGDAKPVYYWYKNACKPVISSADYERFVWNPGEVFNPQLFAINDEHCDVEVKVTARIYSAKGATLHEESHTVAIGPDKSVNFTEMQYTVDPSLINSAFYLYLETEKAGEVVHQNTYYLSVSPDTKFASGMEIGNDMDLDYNGGKHTVSAPYYYTLTDLVDEPTEDVQHHDDANEDQLRAVFSKKFEIAENLKGKALELFLPGMSANDTVFFNGTEVGSYVLDPDTERNYLADPLRWPNLPIRYYSIPADAVKDGENEVTIKMDGVPLKDKTDKRFGLSDMIYLREESSKEEREALSAYHENMEFFTPISLGEKAELSSEIKAEGEGKYSITVSNNSAVTAAFVVLDVENEGNARFKFDEGALDAIHPGQSFTVALEITGEQPAAPKLVLRGLNMTKTETAL